MNKKHLDKNWLGEAVDSLISVRDNLESNYRELRKVSLFLEKLSLEGDFDIYFTLLSRSPKLKQIIERISNHQSKEERENSLKKMVKGEEISLLFDIYQILNHPKEEIENSCDKIDITYKELDAVSIYLKEIDRYPQLSRTEEIELALQMELGNQEAKEKFLKHNLRLVVSVAKKFQHRGVLFADLIQEGNLGLLRAMERYDVHVGTHFSTYAIPWIKSYLMKAVAKQANHLQDSEYYLQKKINYEKVFSEMKQETGISPTMRMMANRMGVSEEEIEKVCMMQSDTLSLDTLVGEMKDSTLENYVSINQEDPFTQNMMANRKKDLEELLKILPEKLRAVIILYFGLHFKKGLSLSEIGKRMGGISHESIRQKEAKAIQKLRESPAIENLAIYMDYPEKAMEYIKFCREVYRHQKYEFYQIDIPKEETNDSYQIPIPINPSPTTEAVTEKEYLLLKEQLLTGKYAEFLQVLTYDEFGMGALKNGWIEGKCFSTKEIANYYQVTTYEVLEANRKFRDFCEKMQAGKVRKMAR